MSGVAIMSGGTTALGSPGTESMAEESVRNRGEHMNNYLILLLIPAIPAALAGIRLYIRRLVERRIAGYQNDLTSKHCEEVDNLYRQTRGWRHDFKNHLQTMQAYLEMGQTEQLSHYIRELTDDYNTIDIAIRTGNAMVDAILNSKLSLVRAKDIRVDATADLPSSLPVSDVDLSVMIGNLLDNAMEACLKVPPEERFLRFYMTKAKDNLYLCNERGGRHIPQGIRKISFYQRQRQPWLWAAENR